MCISLFKDKQFDFTFDTCKYNSVLIYPMKNQISCWYERDESDILLDGKSPRHDESPLLLRPQKPD